MTKLPKHIRPGLIGTWEVLVESDGRSWWQTIGIHPLITPNDLRKIANHLEHKETDHDH